MGGGARFAMYCSLNSLEICVNDVTWPSERLMNQSIVVPTSVLMNNLHRTASEPLTNIICVWKVVRWAFGSSTPVKVALGPTNVAGITASMITCENGIGKSRGGVAGSWSCISHSPAWFRKPLRNSSLVLSNSSFLASDATKSIWCVLDPLLMQPLFLGGPASFPWSVAGWGFRLRLVQRILASCSSSWWIFLVLVNGTVF